MTNVVLPGRPFRVSVAQAVLDDLKDRLIRTRLPAEEIAPSWRFGTPLNYASRLRDRWMHGFDWRLWEARINGFTQRLVPIDGQEIHVVVEAGSGPHPLPLILTHGWPGSFLEFIDLIQPLAHPERFGGRVEDAFTVLVPSLPGFGYSSKPRAPLAPKDIARLWHLLAVKHFGFEAFGAQGGDWGSIVTTNLARFYPAHLVGFHLNTIGGVGLSVGAPPLTEEEAQWAGRAQAVMAPESGYQIVQGTKPQSLAYAQTDSPVGLACWIAEKFQGWTLPGQDADPPFDMDWLLANIMLYWINGSNVPSWLYLFLKDLQPLLIPTDEKLSVPCGFTLFPNDIALPAPRSWLERAFKVTQYRVAESGGHFPALENADVLVGDIRRFFADLR